MNRRSTALLACICLSLIGTPVVSLADVADRVNEIRSRGCGGKRGLSAPLTRTRGMDRIAHEWSNGGRLHQAIERAEYRVVNSASMRVEGTNSEATIKRVFEQNDCEAILNPEFSQIGVFQRDKDVWVVVAKPFAAPTTRDAPAVSQRVLALVNEARAKPRRCGKTTFPAAPPLTLSAMLNRAALAHAQDMLKNEFFEHRGSDGSQPSDRVTRTGYRWRTVAENIALGPTDAAAVVQGWLDSPGHCTNIMGPQYQEMGIAYAVDPRSKGGIYWSQVFATGR